ncbi:hypothetical protein JW935_27440 [candidate division KSB1 bacterium]|nr:hypothetical protein [candidate division KSB1 bacterium]
MKKTTFFITALLIFSGVQTTTAQEKDKKKVVPGEQAPPADPGQRNFGGFLSGQQRPRPQRPRPEPEAFKGDNSGHGMIFTTFEGKRLLIIHHAEERGPRKPQLYGIDDSGDKLLLGPRYYP